MPSTEEYASLWLAGLPSTPALYVTPSPKSWSKAQIFVPSPAVVSSVRSALDSWRSWSALTSMPG